jgi:hypothetical protein
MEKCLFRLFGTILRELVTEPTTFVKGFILKLIICSGKKPTLFQFIHIIQDIEYESKTRINQSLTSQFKRSFKDSMKDSNIEIIKESLKITTFENFFESMVFQVLAPYECWVGIGNNFYEESSDESFDDEPVGSVGPAVSVGSVVIDNFLNDIDNFLKI